jgi:arginase
MKSLEVAAVVAIICPAEIKKRYRTKRSASCGLATARVGWLHDSLKEINMKTILSCFLMLMLVPCCAMSQDAAKKTENLSISVVKMPYRGSRNVAEQSPSPDYLADGVEKVIASLGCSLEQVDTVHLTAEEEKQYGEWQRLALANAHLGELVASRIREGSVPIGLLANCSSLMGMLGGLQHSGPTSRPLRVGLVWIDAHGDFNTPETTLSGMLGGMPVAISAGLCLSRLRTVSGLDPALPPSYITMAGVRDTDPYEQELLDRHQIEMITSAELIEAGDAIRQQMARLSEITDIIYVHVDMDVLDPREVSGHGLSVPGGPSSQELASALTLMFSYPKVAALGIASTPYGEDDPGQLSRKAAYNLIGGAIIGIQQR